MRFPYEVKTASRVGKIYKLRNGTFKTHFNYAGKSFQNTHATVESALLYLKDELAKLDTNSADSVALNPLKGSVRNYAELEELLSKEGEGASLQEAVRFFLNNRTTKKWKPLNFSVCAESFVSAQKTDNRSSIHITTLEKHFRRFGTAFGTKKIHDITSSEITQWLGKQTSKGKNAPWSPKTKKSVRGSLVSLACYAQDVLKAIPDIGKTEFQKVRIPKQDNKPPVDIYDPDEIKKLLESAIETKVALIPAIILGCFTGIRPYEFHAEGLSRPGLSWESINWDDKTLEIRNQKIRSKSTRSVPLQECVLAWLKPFKGQKGVIWQSEKTYDDRMRGLKKKAGVRAIHDGYRHSYASYRIRLLKQDLNELAGEMGNSPQEIISSYKRNVSDAEAMKWFSILPPKGYDQKIKAVLSITPKIRKQPFPKKSVASSPQNSGLVSVV